MASITSDRDENFLPVISDAMQDLWKRRAGEDVVLRCFALSSRTAFAPDFRAIGLYMSLDKIKETPRWLMPLGFLPVQVGGTYLPPPPRAQALATSANRFRMSTRVPEAPAIPFATQLRNFRSTGEVAIVEPPRT